MPPTVEAILREQWEEVQIRREMAGDAWIERGLVFPGPRGDFMCRSTVYDCLQRVAKKAGIGPVRVHDLRHTFAALALEAGVDVRTVQGALGHATPEFTLRVYAYVNDHMRKTAAQKIEAAIGALEKIAQGVEEAPALPEIIRLDA
ncbi:MAG: tyrosine-type recombinase/integrase [bacterium]